MADIPQRHRGLTRSWGQSWTNRLPPLHRDSLEAGVGFCCRTLGARPEQLPSMKAAQERGAGGTPLPSPPATAGPSAALAHTQLVSPRSPTYPSIPSRQAFALTVPSTWSGLSLYCRLFPSTSTTPSSKATPPFSLPRSHPPSTWCVCFLPPQLVSTGSPRSWSSRAEHRKRTRLRSLP